MNATIEVWVTPLFGQATNWNWNLLCQCKLQEKLSYRSFANNWAVLKNHLSTHNSLLDHTWQGPVQVGRQFILVHNVILWDSESRQWILKVLVVISMFVPGSFKMITHMTKSASYPSLIWLLRLCNWANFAGPKITVQTVHTWMKSLFYLKTLVATHPELWTLFFFLRSTSMVVHIAAMKYLPMQTLKSPWKW